MQLSLCCLFFFASAFVATQAQQETPQQSLNQYVAFLNGSVDVLMSRFQMLQTYQAEVERYRKRPDSGLRLPSSGPLEDFYYKKTEATSGLTPAEKQRLTTAAEALWKLLNKIDQTGKTLETYVRLSDYQRDNLKQSDALMTEMQGLFGQFSRERDAFFKQIQRIYRRYQPYLATNPYLFTEKEMEQVLLSQAQLLDSLTYHLNENSPADWPVDRVQQRMLADEKALNSFGKAKATLKYPASDMVGMFREALQTIQGVKRRAIDDYTFAARQSAQHGNSVYLDLLKQYNQSLLASYQSFVDYSRPNRQLLHSPKYSPVFVLESAALPSKTVARTAPFTDKSLLSFATKPAVVPASRPTYQALNGHVTFINESLRQMHLLQLLLRNYQSSAEYYRDPARSRQRANLSYAHDDYKMPVAEYQLLLNSSQQIPQPYRSAINTQAEVLLGMLKEMDGLSIELIGYTTRKEYLQDQLQRSDAILDRYAYLFDTFDQKKEQLYRDVRRIFDSYPTANPASSWNVAGKSMLKTLDDDTEILFGVKAYFKLETAQLPATDKLETGARTLIRDEYQNLKGLQRLGRSNGLCPYTRYENLAENSLRFAGLPQRVKPVTPATTRHPYEEFYYLYNNELVYEYNQFTELAKEKLLMAVNQPDLFAFRRTLPTNSLSAVPKRTQPPVNPPAPTVNNQPVKATPRQTEPEQKVVQRDTVYVERTKVDTVFVDRGSARDVPNSLDGFASNNMVLLLDVSSSMDSPIKLPLLKRSVKSLLSLLRPEDQISVVTYSGKARLVLKPTSGANTDEIARVIDGLRSDGDTDGNRGIQLAYKVANQNYIRAGNNRIILATDGEFPVSDEVFQLIAESARQDVYLTVFTFGRNPLTGQNLKKLSQLGKGTFMHVTPQNANLQLVQEAQAKKRPTR